MDENDLTLLLTILWILSSKSNQEKALTLFNLIKSLSQKARWGESPTYSDYRTLNHGWKVI